jgi:hypothetical protein
LNALWQNDEDSLGGYKLEFMAYLVVLCLSNFGVTGVKFSLGAEMCEPMEHGLQYVFFTSCKKFIIAFLIAK